MHELSIASSLLEAAVAVAHERDAVRIVRIDCRIGRFRQIDVWLLGEAFDLDKVDSIAADARLNVETVGARLNCSGCGETSELRDWDFKCPLCHSSAGSVTGGDELELTSVELEVPDGD